MSVSCKLQMITQIVDTSSHALVKTTDASRSWKASVSDLDTTLNSSSTPDLENVAVFIGTLSGGALTIDLTNLTHADGDTRSASAKKLRFLHVTNPSANTGNIILTKGASNGYSPIGTTFTLPVSPGGSFVYYFDSDAADVTDASADTIDVTGTGSETFYVKLGWG